MHAKHHVSIDEILIRGSDILKAKPNFRLLGREQEIIDLCSILMKMRKNNLIITGRGGVGISAIVLGLQDSKKKLSTPVDIVSKRFHWLDTDKLFESGRQEIINDSFQRVRRILSTTRDTILVLEDTVDFIRAAQHSGCMNLINGLMGDLKNGKYQAILEAQDDAVGEVLKCDGDILEFSSLYEVKEPDLERLHIIVGEVINDLIRHHSIKVSDDAATTAIHLTERYKLSEFRAQPDAAITLLDHTLTDKCIHTHSNPPRIAELKQQLIQLESSNIGAVRETTLTALKQEEIQQNKLSLEKELASAQEEWASLQSEIRALHRDISDGESEIRKLEDEIAFIREGQFHKAREIESAGDSGSQSQSLGTFSSLMASGNVDIPEISSLRERIRKIRTLVDDASSEYKSRANHILAELEISGGDVLRTFSAISGIPVDKLSEDERNKLKSLESDLSKRVIGQEEPVLEVSKAVKRARLGLKMPNKPSGTFMFLGPSGVGKTELAKALADSLDVPLLRFDMSEYMEKHAVAKLIGAPPGYEGFESGGILTNAVRRNPYSVVLFDEIEKAHRDVFNVMLQLLDDARLTDSRGLTASFKDTIVIMTTNIGTLHFLDEAVSFTEAKEVALSELREEYRPEFLGRFGGNIYCFKKLELEVLLSITKKDLSRINSLISDKGIELVADEVCLKELIKRRYVPREGARSILGYIDRNVTSGIADVLLGEDIVTGQIILKYNTEEDRVELLPK